MLVDVSGQRIDHVVVQCNAIVNCDLPHIISEHVCYEEGCKPVLSVHHLIYELRRTLRWEADLPPKHRKSPSFRDSPARPECDPRYNTFPTASAYGGLWRTVEVWVRVVVVCISQRVYVKWGCHGPATGGFAELSHCDYI